MPLYDTAHKRISVKFFVVALVFIVFDVEATFLYPWAVYFREACEQGLGLFLLGEIGVFFLLLGLGYVYLWRKGAFEWER